MRTFVTKLSHCIALFIKIGPVDLYCKLLCFCWIPRLFQVVFSHILLWNTSYQVCIVLLDWKNVLYYSKYHINVYFMGKTAWDGCLGNWNVESGKNAFSVNLKIWFHSFKKSSLNCSLIHESLLLIKFNSHSINCRIFPFFVKNRQIWDESRNFENITIFVQVAFDDVIIIQTCDRIRIIFLSNQVHHSLEYLPVFSVFQILIFYQVSIRLTSSISIFPHNNLKMMKKC